MAAVREFQLDQGDRCGERRGTDAVLRGLHQASGVHVAAGEAPTYA